MFVLARKKTTVEATVKEEAPVKKRGRKPAAEKAAEPVKVTAVPEEKPVKKAARTRKVKAPDPVPEKAAETVVKEEPKAAPKKTRAKKEKAPKAAPEKTTAPKAAEAPEVAEAPKAEPIKEEKPAKKAPAAKKPRTASKGKTAKTVSVELQFASGNYTADEIAEKCKEAYRAGTKKQVKTLEVYVNAAEAKAFYVVNGKSADENGNAYSIDL